MLDLEVEDITYRLFTSATQILALGSNPTESWSISPVVMPVNTWTEMFKQTFRSQPAGKLIWAYFYIKYRAYATTATADVIERIRARNMSSVTGVASGYVNISNELPTVDINITPIVRVTSGYVVPQNLGAGSGSFSVMPFDLSIQMQSNEADTGRLEVSSESYVRILHQLM